jgi:hypothetical protein
MGTFVTSRTVEPASSASSERFFCMHMDLLAGSLQSFVRMRVFCWSSTRRWALELLRFPASMVTMTILTLPTTELEFEMVTTPQRHTEFESYVPKLASVATENPEDYISPTSRLHDR